MNHPIVASAVIALSLTSGDLSSDGVRTEVCNALEAWASDRAKRFDYTASTLLLSQATLAFQSGIPTCPLPDFNTLSSGYCRSLGGDFHTVAAPNRQARYIESKNGEPILPPASSQTPYDHDNVNQISACGPIDVNAGIEFVSDLGDARDAVLPGPSAPFDRPASFVRPAGTSGWSWAEYETHALIGATLDTRTGDMILEIRSNGSGDTLYWMKPDDMDGWRIHAVQELSYF